MTLLASCLLAISCATVNLQQETSSVNRVVDDWHKAAANADEQRYFGAMAPEFVFLGTDATERWDLTSFRNFAHPFFAKGKAWTFTPRDRTCSSGPRNVRFSPMITRGILYSKTAPLHMSQGDNVEYSVARRYWAG